MRIAVIDIGSNAIRTAVYDNNKLGSAEIYNEKFKSDIISLLEQEELNCKHSTYNIFSYFLHIFSQLKVEIIECVATEVLRNHAKVKEFIKIIDEKYNIKIRVLSGDEEARLAACGLISSIPDASGIAADLGGGSLELAEVGNKQINMVKSLRLGTKVLFKQQIENSSYIQASVEAEFTGKTYQNLYLIGGAFRLIGRCYMDYTNCIVKNLHNLVIDPEEFIKFLEQLTSLQKFQQFFKQYKVNKYAILAVRGLIDSFKPQKLIVSTFGLKEGVRFKLLSIEEQKKDIVLERCLDLTPNNSQKFNIEAYQQLYKSIEINTDEFCQKMFIIALILCQYTKNIDRNYRAESLISFVLTTDIPFNQLQRATLIVAIATSLSTKINVIPKPIKKILSKQQFSNAQIIGALIKICLLIDGPVLSKPTFNINLKNFYLEIVTNQILPRLIFEKICEQLKLIGILRREYANELQVQSSRNNLNTDIIEEAL